MLANYRDITETKIMSEIKIGVMKGDFIGPEIIGATLPIVEKAARRGGVEVEFVDIPVSAEAYDATGEHLPASSIETARQMDAVLKGPFGGPPNTDDPRYSGVERKSVLALREELGVYANLRPIKTLGGIGLDLSPLKEEVAKDRDIMIVRELSGDAYYGERDSGVDEVGKRYAYETIYYDEEQVERIVRKAIEIADERDDVLTLAHKTNVLKETGGLWMDIFQDLTSEAGIDTDYMHIDNAAAAILGRFKRGTLLTPNMFGDILSDENAATMGSIGMGGSASLGDGSFGLYEPIGGSAPDMENVADANPVGMMMSAALMFRYSLDMPAQGELIEQAVTEVLDDHCLTPDLIHGLEAESWATQVDARELGDIVLDEI
jgi:3-isopropylmalate dehydrogenase